MRAGSAQRIKRKLKKFFKSKWIKALILAFAVFAALAVGSFAITMLIVQIVGGTIAATTLLKASVLISAIVTPLMFKECLGFVERSEVIRRANKRRHKATTKKSDM